MSWYIPLLIFFARIMDVSIGTIRIITVIRGHKVIAAVLGFFEVTIWVIAVSAVISHIGESLWALGAYGGGFAAGTLIGMWLEEKIALGDQMLRVVNTDASLSVAHYLRNSGYVVTEALGRGASGPAEICFLVVPRKRATRVTRRIHAYCPGAFITVEDLRSIRRGSLPLGPATSSADGWRRLIKLR